MATTLLELWRDKQHFIQGKLFRQIIQLAGDGKLRDGNSTSQELRDWLAAIPLGKLRDCLEECLTDPFEESPRALQDATNEVGVRLGFSVARGRYRGVKNEIGHDGLWRAHDDFASILEVKTSDAYRINLDTIAGYRDKLAGSGQIDARRSSILIAVGRQDTGDLEAQIRGSRHAWDIRLISLDSLLRLAEVKEEVNDLVTGNKINQLIRPVEYTRLDGIVELHFAAKKDLEIPAAIAPPNELVQSPATSPLTAVNLEEARDGAVLRISSKLGCTFVRRGRALRVSSDGGKRLVCLASQRYDGPGGAGNYWFGFTPAQRDFLAEGGQGWVALVCADSQRCYLMEWEHFAKWLPAFLTTPSAANEANLRHWHVYFYDYGDHVDLFKSGGGVVCDLMRFLLPTN